MNTQVFVSREDALDIVFANRNRNYGAYQLRRQYPVTLGRALGIGLLLIALMLTLPHLMKAFSGLLLTPEKPIEERELTRVVLSVPPTIPPPLPSTPPPLARAKQRFVPPVVEEDNKVEEEPPKLSNEELTKDPAEVGKVTVEGPAEGPPIIDDRELGGIIESKEPAGNDEPKELFDLQKLPSFPGGETEMLRYLAKNIHYPDIAKETNIQGTVVLSFVIGKDGSINDVAILRELGGGCSKEAVRVLKTMPKWTPGEANGHAVKVRFTIPVRFSLK